jgi:hypothetical protein
MVDGARATLMEGNTDLEVVGESHYQRNLWSLAGRIQGRTGYGWGSRPCSSPRATTPHDTRRSGCGSTASRSGNLSGHDARRLRPGLLAAQARHRTPIGLVGVIAGGGMRTEGPGRLGVFLNYDPEALVP